MEHVLLHTCGSGHAMSPNDSPSMSMDLDLLDIILDAIMDDAMTLEAARQEIK